MIPQEKKNRYTPNRSICLAAKSFLTAGAGDLTEDLPNINHCVVGTPTIVFRMLYFVVYLLRSIQSHRVALRSLLFL